MSRFTKPKPHYQQYIDTYSPRALINDYDEFLTWILNNYELSDLVVRCPGIVSELLEAYNNDWIEHVEYVAETMGLQLDEEFNVVIEDIEPDEEEE